MDQGICQGSHWSVRMRGEQQTTVMQDVAGTLVAPLVYVQRAGLVNNPQAVERGRTDAGPYLAVPDKGNIGDGCRSQRVDAARRLFHTAANRTPQLAVGDAKTRQHGPSRHTPTEVKRLFNIHIAIVRAPRVCVSPRQALCGEKNVTPGTFLAAG